MKKIITIFMIAVIVLAAVGGGAVFAFAKTATLPQPKATILSISGETRIKKAGSQEWSILSKDTDLSAEDALKTGADGEIVINFYDNSSSRLGPDTEITLSQLAIDDTNYSKTNISLTVTVGRVWSRIMQLADREASFEVQSNTTVATVRGTALDFAVSATGSTTIDTAENIVEVSLYEPIQEKNQVRNRKLLSQISLQEGDRVETSSATSSLLATKIPDETKNGAWFKQNQEKDEKFDQEIKDKFVKQNEELSGILPDSPLYQAKLWAEQTRLALSDQESRNRLEAEFLSRRLAEQQLMVNQGKNALAEKLGQAINEQITNVFSNQENQEKYFGYIKNQINHDRPLFDSVLPDSGAYEIKKNLENTLIDNSKGAEDQQFFRYKQLEERLKEVAALKKLDKAEMAESLLQDTSALIDKFGQQKNDAGLFNRLQIIEKIKNSANTGNETPSTDQGPTNTDKSQPATDMKNPNQTAVPNMTSDKQIDTPATAEKKADVSPKPVAQPQTPTQTQLTPKADSDQSSPAQPTPTTPEPAAQPQEPAAKKLTSLTVSATNYNMLANSTKQMTATAHYSDGSTKNVTHEASWSLSGDLGTISGNGLIRSGSGGGGSATATYGEDGITVSDTSPEIMALSLEM